VTRLLGVAALAMAAGVMVVSRIGQGLAARPDVQPADAIVVLGGEWPNRIERGVALFRRGLAPAIWITGGGHATSPAALSVALARRAGVPADAIHVLTSTNTWEDGGVAAARAAEAHARSVLLVTNWYHSRRALCVMRRQFSGSGVSLHLDTVPNARYDAGSWWRHAGGWFRVSRELAAFGWYWIRYGLPPWEC
jgi:uncharacterized SAM-binding protein YcdF (DUF218 family)